MSTETEVAEDVEPRRLRIWPGFVIPVVVAGFLFLPTLAYQGTFIQFLSMVVGPALGIITFFVWWFMASRAPNELRLPMIVCYVISAMVAAVMSHHSMSFILYMFGAPSVVGIFAVALWGVRGAPVVVQKRIAGVAIVLGWAFFCLLRCDGLDGYVIPQFSFRWSPSAEDRYLAQLDALPESDLANESSTDNSHDAEPKVIADAPPSPPSSRWPGFRGLRRDGHASGVEMPTDWDAHPPRQRWRRPVGPGWSSFAVVGRRAYTQEQRDQEEMVVCIDLSNGANVWSRPIGGRFYERIGGAGPRATPSYYEGKVYALSATGTIACLDAISGELMWSSQLAEDGGMASGQSVDDSANFDEAGLVKTPPWGFSSSPLVMDGQVVVFAGGNAGNSVLAYDLTDGQLRWAAGSGKHTYSSPHLATLAGAEQILMASDVGIESLAPDGQRLWRHDWLTPAYRVVQPAVVGNQILIGTNNNMGTRKLTVERAESSNQWNVEVEWTSRDMKPYFNDFVVHKDHVYGFDNSILVCLDLATGKRTWKGGRYGAGQLVLLEDQDLLLVITERTGELVLLKATPESHQEIGRLKVTDAKTWNHPVVVDNLLLIRNGEEASAWEFDAP